MRVDFLLPPMFSLIKMYLLLASLTYRITFAEEYSFCRILRVKWQEYCLQQKIMNLWILLKYLDSNFIVLSMSCRPCNTAIKLTIEIVSVINLHYAGKWNYWNIYIYGTKGTTHPLFRISGNFNSFWIWKVATVWYKSFVAFWKIKKTIFKPPLNRVTWDGQHARSFMNWFSTF